MTDVAEPRTPRVLDDGWLARRPHRELYRWADQQVDAPGVLS